MKMENRMDEKLPQVVEDKLQEAYEMIRRGEVKQMKRKKHTYRKWVNVAAACAVIMAVSVSAVAAFSYFQKEAHQDKDQIVYEFDINYELVPGEYQVTPRYLPEGFIDQGAGKYYGDDGLGITVMPIYTTAELDKINGQIAVDQIENVEHRTLSGMEADIITFQEAKKYQRSTYVFLFNEVEGYVLQLVSCYTVEQEELLKFADNLTVERIGDGAFELAEEKAARQQKEADAQSAALEGKKTYEALVAAGIPQEKIFKVGEEMIAYFGACGYTVESYEFLDSIAGFDEDKFFEYASFADWLNEDKTLKPYTRQYYDSNGILQSEEVVEQEILRVNFKVHFYGTDELNMIDVPLNFSIENTIKREDGSYTWESGFYSTVPEENYSIRMDDYAVYFDQAIHTEGADRSHYFFRDMEVGEELSYTLLFVVDKDRAENGFLLSPDGANCSIWNTDSMTINEIWEELEGYILIE